jgi:hypothetical protein
MAQVRRELDFAAESLRTQGEAQLRKKHLDGNFSIVLEIPSQVDRGHRPVTELTLDLVMFGEGSFDAVELGRHTSGGKRGACRPTIRLFPSARQTLSWRRYTR